MTTLISYPISVFYEVARRGVEPLPTTVQSALSELTQELRIHCMNTTPGTNTNTNTNSNSYSHAGNTHATKPASITRMSHMARKQLTSSSISTSTPSGFMPPPHKRDTSTSTSTQHTHTHTHTGVSTSVSMGATTHHKCGVDGQVDQIRLCLNKLSDKNYQEMQARICLIMDQLFPSDLSDEFDLTIEKDRIKQSTYDICSHTKFFSQYYSQVYVALCLRYPWLQTHLDTQLDAYLPSFQLIRHVSSDTHYDQFCDMNKRNEQRKANATFFVHLSEQGLMNPLRIQQFTDALLQETMDHVMYQDTDTNTNTNTNTLSNEAMHWRARLDEMSEHVSILYRGPMSLSQKGIQQVHALAWMKAKECRCLSSKAIFKYMAIEDTLPTVPHAIEEDSESKQDSMV